MAIKQFAAAAALAVLLAGCAPSPEARIVNACMRDGGNSRETCACFAENLKQNLTAEQLAVVAEAVSSSDDAQAQQRMQERLGMNGMVAVMGAAKSCNMTN